MKKGKTFKGKFGIELHGGDWLIFRTEEEAKKSICQHNDEFGETWKGKASNDNIVKNPTVEFGCDFEIDGRQYTCEK